MSIFQNDTYQAKHKMLLKQYQLYDQFLIDPETNINFKERSKLIYEMGRMQSVIDKIESMPYMETRKTTDDFPLIISSCLNPKEPV